MSIQETVNNIEQIENSTEQTENNIEKDEMNELHKILNPLKININETNIALENIQNLYEQKFLRQQRQILNLQTRLQSVEERLLYQEHITDLHSRKIDDQEQVSRKVNLRLKGIELNRDDSPDLLMGKIKSEIHDLGIDIPDEELDRCHRDGKVYISRASFANDYRQKRVQDVLVRFRTWRSRDLMFQRRKEFSFIVDSDLTRRRFNLLKFIRDEIKSATDDVDAKPNLFAVGRVVDFAYADKNCKIKFKVKKGKFFTVSSEDEFLNLVNRLDLELTLSDNIKNDENNRSKYGLFEEEKTLGEIYY